MLNRFLSLSGIWLGGTSSLFFHRWSSYFSSDIVLGIYEDYMSPSMANHILNKYGIRLDYIQHDQVVKDRINSRVYGMSVVSTSILEELVNANLVEKVDWSKLQLKNGSNSISESKDAKELFTEVIGKVVDSNQRLLEYGIPYFMSRLSFCYVGEKISALESSVKWSQVLENIGKESRFKSQNGSPRLGMIEDPRTLLSLSRFVGGESDVNIDDQANTNSEKIYANYGKLLEKLKPLGKPVFLDPVSSTLVDSLVNGDISGAIMYNSDCLYASYGGNLGESRAPKTIHMVDIQDEIYFLDFLVFSKGMREDQREKIYNFYKEVLMEGYGESDPLVKDGDEYKHWLSKNFDHVKYTPSVKKLNEKVISDYFKDAGDKKDYREKALKIETNKDNSEIKKHYESPFSSKLKSDMLIAFSKFKGNL